MITETTCKPVIFGCSGTELTSEERDFFSISNPFGFILFGRNIETPNQVRELVASLRDSISRKDVPVFIDKEGGRVTRLKPPHWSKLPSMHTLGELYKKDKASGKKAIQLHSLITAYRLIDLGINGNCAPVLDLKIDGANNVIGDRSFGYDPLHVASCAKIVMETFLSCGVFPVIKHIPGHGRVTLDPHFDLPYVDTDISTLETEDFIPFRELTNAPMAMNCHVVFNSLDDKRPVSLSPKVHKEIIRGKLNYNGLIFSDDLAMGALKIPLESRGIEALNAGADIIMYCSGVLSEMKKINKNLPDISTESVKRWNIAKSKVNKTANDVDIDLPEMENKFQSYLIK